MYQARAILIQAVYEKDGVEVARAEEKHDVSDWFALVDWLKDCMKQVLATVEPLGFVYDDTITKSYYVWKHEALDKTIIIELYLEYLEPGAPGWKVV